MMDIVPNNMITLLDVRNQLMAIFCEKGIFESSDMQAIKLPSDLNGKREAIVTAGLAQIQDTGLIRRISDDTWMLTHPMGASGQEVKLSMTTCNEIATVINAFLKAQNDDETPNADALNINEGHIITLLQILDVVLMDDKADGSQKNDDDDPDEEKA